VKTDLNGDLKEAIPLSSSVIIVSHSIVSGDGNGNSVSQSFGKVLCTLLYRNCRLRRLLPMMVMGSVSCRSKWPYSLC